VLSGQLHDTFCFVPEKTYRLPLNRGLAGVTVDLDAFDGRFNWHQRQIETQILGLPTRNVATKLTENFQLLSGCILVYYFLKTKLLHRTKGFGQP
jgi:hypothetical protein